MINYNTATYMTSAAKFEQLPEDSGIEVAFCGRSNAGKSSAINVLTGKKNLTRVSKTPGRTQLIHLFQLDEIRRLVDLPGYGYAKVAEKIKWRWQQTLAMYLTKRKCLKGIVLLVDSRHPIKAFDRMMVKSAIEYGLDLHILLTKADKLSHHQLIKCQQQLQRDLAEIKNIANMSFQVFSALNGIGLDTFKEKLNSWYNVQSLSQCR